MPRVIAYPEVLESLLQRGLISLYHNSGAFGFAEEIEAESVGWILRDDPTIRASARAIARVVDPPTEKQLATMSAELWANHLAHESVWVMPKSHWAYELDFGNHQWMPTVLDEAGVRVDQLRGRNDGSAIEFSANEREVFAIFVQRLLSHLAGSDFMFVFTSGSAICTVHHHKQLWWTTREPAVAAALRSLNQ